MLGAPLEQRLEDLLTDPLLVQDHVDVAALVVQRPQLRAMSVRHLVQPHIATRIVVRPFMP